MKYSERKISQCILPFRNFTKSTGRHLCQSVFFNKVAGRPGGFFWLLPIQVNIKDTGTTLSNAILLCFYGQFLKAVTVARRCSSKQVFLKISQDLQKNICVKNSTYAQKTSGRILKCRTCICTTPGKKRISGEYFHWPYLSKSKSYLVLQELVVII